MPRPSLRLGTVHLIASLAAIGGAEPLLAAPPTAASITASLSRTQNPTSLNGTASLRMDAEQTVYPWKLDIVGTVFWVGELPTQNNPTPNTSSSWDPKWMKSFGGYDDPDIAARAADYRPSGFVPKLNPFYVALPYNDVLNYKTTKDEVSRIIPWYKDTFDRPGKSICNNRWIAIRHNGRTCYAQWSDCGPFLTTDADYVFGDARPINTKNKGAGIDLAPAVRDYLGFRSGKTCDWRFVEESEVPDGPWKDFGTNNPFSLDAAKVASMPTRTKTVTRSSGNAISSSESNSAAAARLEELRRQRDAWFKENGAKNRSR